MTVFLDVISQSGNSHRVNVDAIDRIEKLVTGGGCLKLRCGDQLLVPSFDELRKLLMHVAASAMIDAAGPVVLPAPALEAPTESTPSLKCPKCHAGFAGRDSTGEAIDCSYCDGNGRITAEMYVSLKDRFDEQVGDLMYHEARERDLMHLQDRESAENGTLRDLWHKQTADYAVQTSELAVVKAERDRLQSELATERAWRHAATELANRHATAAAVAIEPVRVVDLPPA